MKEIQIRLRVAGTQFAQFLSGKFRAALLNERGDVPGWVLITVMTAGLVVGLWSIAGPQLKTVLTNALHSVTTP
jgi:hypothetical protein